MKRFLVLGVGNAQVDLIRALQGRYEVHACSYIREGPGLPLADVFAQIDITRKEDVLVYCREQAMDCVYSIGSDVAMPTASWVSEQLGLPFLVSSSAAIDCNAKHRFRQLLSGTPFHIRHQQVTSVDEPLDLPFPVMVKPADSQGQRGVRAVGSLKEYKAHLPIALGFSRAGVAIVEELLAGPEISVNTFVSDGQVVFSLISDRLTWPNLPGGLVRGHHVPSRTAGPDIQSEIRRLVESVVERLGIRNGPAYFQIMVDQGTPKLIEVTPRLDGCHLWRMILLATGVDLLELSLEALENRGRAGIPQARDIEGEWHLDFFCQPPDTVFHRSAHPVHADSVYHEFFSADGDIIGKMNGYMEKCGYQIIKGTP